MHTFSLDFCIYRRFDFEVNKNIGIMPKEVIIEADAKEVGEVKEALRVVYGEGEEVEEEAGKERT